jgi:hypothetical protein
VTKLVDDIWFSKFQDRHDFTIAGLVGGWREVMAKPFDFMDDPCTFARIDGRAVIFKTLEDVSNFANMIIPISVEDADIIKKLFVGCATSTGKDVGHGSLHPVSGWLESHQDARVLVFSKKAY